MPKSIKIGGASFNVDAIGKMTEAQFVNHEMHENHFTDLKANAKKAFLAKTYKQIVGAIDKVKSPPKGKEPAKESAN